jgi:hypothetical protein
MIKITDTIRELHAEGLHVLPLRHNGEKFIHPQYSGSFDKPFSTEELEKFFADGYNNAYAVIHGKCNPYLKCLDFDEKNAPGKDLYGTWQMLVDPDLLSKLVIERTRSNGYHVYFLCTNKVVEKALASSATGQEWIACRSSEMHGLVYAAPSPGYTYHQGSLFDLQEISGDEMAQLCDAACQLNEYTGEKNFKSTSLAPVQMPANYAAALRAFDREVDDSYILSFLQDQGWTIGERVRKAKVNGEDWDFVQVWRPGRTMSEARSGCYWFTNKRLSIFSASTDFPFWDSGHSFSHSPSRVLYFMMKKDWKAVMSFIGEKAEELAIKLPEVTPMAFANPVRGGEVWKVEVKGIIEWAERAGFCWMRMSASSDTVVELIRVVDNIIYVCDEKDLLRAYREEVEANYNGEQSSRVLHAFMPSVFKYMSALPNFDGDLMRDEKDCSYMYFSNGALRISAGNVSLVKYSDLPGCVFARHIKNFEYKGHQGTGDFAKFIGFVSVDDDHRRHIMSCLGYILHHYKLRNYAKALMIIEDVEDQEEARGRSGKGLIAQFIEWIRWTVQQDGRNYKSDSQFKMQQIVPGVQVFYLNDPAPNVLMNQFYNFITDDWLVESKGKKSYTIPFKHSPKIMITTNYLPNLESDSDKDRFIVMAIKKHYGSHRSIRDDFPDVIFFSEDWPHPDKLMAVNFAIECIQLYLNHGVVNYTSEPMKRNAAQRIIKNLVPEALIETLEQAMEACRASDSAYQFGELLKPYDLKKDTSESMSKAFDWKNKQELIIYKSALYQYVSKAYSMKNMTDRVFGKKVNTYLEKSGYAYEMVRNNTKGIRILVHLAKFDCTENDGLTALENSLTALKSDIDNLEDPPF